MIGLLSVTILIPGPPGMLGVFQAGIYAGMTMYYPTSVVTGPGPAYVFLVYGIQVVWQLLGAGIFLVLDRGSLQALEAAEVSKEVEEDAVARAPGKPAES
jgi:hypothetical protein